MTPKAGEVYIVDLGVKGKVRPVVVVSREDSNAPRALSVVVPLTSQSRGSRYEVKMRVFLGSISNHLPTCKP